MCKVTLSQQTPSRYIHVRIQIHFNGTRWKFSVHAMWKMLRWPCLFMWPPTGFA